MAKRLARRTAPWITLLTDFGWRDGYVAAMRGVLASLAPRARIVDAAHDLPPGDVQAAAWVLSQYWRLWPSGTIHVAVVDPGVGTDRAAVLAEADGRWLLAPDNGLLTGVAADARRFRVWRLRADVRRPGGNSTTFHGRDVFAYAAARLASGVRPRRLANEPIAIRRFEGWTAQRVGSGCARGVVLHIDRFGNAITNLRPADLPPRTWEVRSGRVRLRHLSRTYGDVAAGGPLLYVGSAGRLEVAIRDGAAAERLGLKVGDAIWVLARRSGEGRPRSRNRPGGSP